MRGDSYFPRIFRVRAGPTMPGPIWPPVITGHSLIEHFVTGLGEADRVGCCAKDTLAM
jgi:hypothetical protein